jgi:hypothetical protein
MQYMMHIWNNRKLINNKSKLAATGLTFYSPLAVAPYYFREDKADAIFCTSSLGSDWLCLICIGGGYI